MKIISNLLFSALLLCCFAFDWKLAVFAFFVCLVQFAEGLNTR